jgi:HAD superfamily phosphatase (TIGR01668 family)
MSDKSTFNLDFFLNLHLLFQLKKAIPDHQVHRLQDIQGILEKTEIEAIIFDIDQTVVPFGETSISKNIRDFIRGLKPKYRMCFLSNFPYREDRIQRIRSIEEQAGFKAIFSQRRKPSPEAFRLALDELKSEPQNTMMVGDRLLTDILGGNNMKIETVLVQPIDRRTDPLFMVKLPRALEGPYLKLARLITKKK